ncbi:NAD(P)/FAD-dependent oxidoreductase [Cereibacter changlensis]|nr:FAD/NAD(P)-binding oxidoreductase [Cereibacter changlensis]PZX51688.1 thioredoxin reductase [Cereibacter changlensis]
MTDMPREVDVLIVGAGPAGLAAATELRRRGVGLVLVLDREPAPGGIPRHCGHSPYGLREFRRPMTGPAYAERLAEEAVAAGVEIRCGISVMSLLPGPVVEISSNAGVRRIAARRVLLATGVRETSRAGRLIGGSKPGGVMNTGALQGLVYLDGLRPFRAPLILGSELVSFSALLTCRHAGARPVGMVEPGPRPTARFPSALLPRLLGVPLWLGTELLAIEGRDRVTGAVLRGPEGERRVACDGVVVTGRFRPEATLVRSSHLALDPATGGPEVDGYGRCSDSAYFAAGNLLRPVETAGVSWSEGCRIGAAMAEALADALPPPGADRISLGGEGLAWVMPQRRGGAALGLQLRVSRAVSGRLSVRVDGREVASRLLTALPERRISLDLPAAQGPVEIVLEEGR